VSVHGYIGISEEYSDVTVHGYLGMVRNTVM
jgi:hypothetical protein